jgi:hypothetical protein
MQYFAEAGIDRYRFDEEPVCVESPLPGLKPGHYGCGQHFAKIISNHDNNILYIEDDAIIPPDFKVRLDHHLKQLPADWDFFIAGYNGINKDATRHTSGDITHISTRYFYGAQCIALRKGEKKKELAEEIASNKIYESQRFFDVGIAGWCREHDAKLYLAAASFVGQGGCVSLTKTGIELGVSGLMPQHELPVLKRDKWLSAVGLVTNNSANYIREWIAHQYIVGFDKIIVMLDKPTDDTYEQIQRLPHYVLDKVDIHSNPPSHERGIAFQSAGYQKIYNLYKDRVEWLAMFDDDEYFYDHKKRSINELLQNIPEDVSQVVLPWILFGHNNRATPPTFPTTRFEWFQKVFTQEEIHQWFNPFETKSIVRLSDIVTKTTLDDVWDNDWYHTHSAIVKNRSTTFDGNDCKWNTRWSSETAHAHYDTCLAHYCVGSMEEFALRCKRWLISGMRHRRRKTKWVPERFPQSVGTIVDARMMLYVDELKKIMSECYAI